MQQRTEVGVLPVVITVLALVDGFLHYALNFILFRGPPPGARPAGSAPPRPPGGGPLIRPPLPLNVDFQLYCVGAIILVLLFWFGPRLLGISRRVVEFVMILYAVGAILAWIDIGKPYAMGLGPISKGIEVLLILALILHASRQRSSVRQVASVA